MDNEFLRTTERISNVVDFLLKEGGQEGWELNNFQVTKIVDEREKHMKCERVFINGKWELVCKEI